MNKKIGIIGAGVMGCAITSLFSNCGYKVILFDNDKNALEKASNQIRKNDIVYIMNKKSFKHETHAIASGVEELRECAFVIEAASENKKVKERLFNELSEICCNETVIVSNTSCIPISRLAEYYRFKENVVGVHFMNPVPLIDTVEVIKTQYTLEHILNEVKGLLKTVEKNYIVVNDSPGFVSNRISHLYMNEAAYLLEENVATAEAIDGIFKKCYAHKMGPLETADLIGIDVVVDSLKVLYQEFQSEKYKCCPLLEDMVKRGDLGRKTGKGFYKY